MRETRLAFLSRDPVPLTNGKSAWHMFGPLASFFPLLQRIGHKGVVVTHYVFDRMAFSSLERKARQRHALYHLRAGGSEGGVDGGLPDLLDWVCSTACGNHDGQNALKWGLKLLGFDQAAVHKALWVAIASCRNAYDLVSSFIHDFVVRYLSPQARMVGYSTAYTFWVALGVEVNVCELLAELGLFWHNGKLVVDRALLGRESLISDAEHCITTVLKFKQFSDSRWVTMGGSCRTITAGRQLGLDHLVSMIRADGSTSDYYIHGYAELGKEARIYSTIAALVCNIPDALLLELLEDPRLAVRVKEVKAAVDEEVAWLKAVPMWTWKRLALQLDGVSGVGLRSKALTVAQSMLAFMKLRVWDEVSRLPWSLCSGDIAGNIVALRDGPDAVEHTIIKIQKLAGIHYRMSALVDGVQRLGDVPWSTSAHEQGHGSAAIVHKLHPGYSTQRITARGFLHICRALYSPPPVNALLKKTEAAIARLDRKQPQQTGGQQMFLKDLMHTVAGDGALTQSQTHAVMASHARLFDRLSVARQKHYCTLAEEHAEAKEKEIVADRSHMMSQRALAVVRLAEEQRSLAPQLRVSNCTFTDSDWEVLAVCWNDEDKWHANSVESIRKKASTPPVVPEQVVMHALEEVQLISPAEAKQPGWCNTICRHRDEFVDCIVIVNGPAGEHAFAFMFAMQNPLESGFLRLSPAETRLSVSMMRESLLTLLAAQWAFTFQVCWGEVVLGKEMPDVVHGSVSVVPHALVKGDLMVADAVATPLDEFVPDVAKANAPRDPASTPRLSSASGSEPLVAHRWLQKFMDKEKAASSGGAHGGSAAPGERRERDMVRVADMEVDEVELAFAELEAQREEFRQGAQLWGDDFKTNILGGAWTLGNKAVAGDRVKCWPANKAAKKFAIDFFDWRETSVAIGKFTRRGVYACAVLLCRRLQHFYDIWVCQGDDGYSFTDLDVASAPTDLEQDDPLDDYDEDHPARTRLAALATLAPKAR